MEGSEESEQQAELAPEGWPPLLSLSRSRGNPNLAPIQTGSRRPPRLVSSSLSASTGDSTSRPGSSSGRREEEGEGEVVEPENLTWASLTPELGDDVNILPPETPPLELLTGFEGLPNDAGPVIQPSGSSNLPTLGTMASPNSPSYNEYLANWRAAAMAQNRQDRLWSSLSEGDLDRLFEFEDERIARMRSEALANEMMDEADYWKTKLRNLTLTENENPVYIGDPTEPPTKQGDAAADDTGSDDDGFFDSEASVDTLLDPLPELSLKLLMEAWGKGGRRKKKKKYKARLGAEKDEGGALLSTDRITGLKGEEAAKMAQTTSVNQLIDYSLLKDKPPGYWFGDSDDEGGGEEEEKKKEKEKEEEEEEDKEKNQDTEEIGKQEDIAGKGKEIDKAETVGKRKVAVHQGSEGSEESELGVSDSEAEERVRPEQLFDKSEPTILVYRENKPETEKEKKKKKKKKERGYISIFSQGLYSWDDASVDDTSGDETGNDEAEADKPEAEKPEGSKAKEDKPEKEKEEEGEGSDTSSSEDELPEDTRQLWEKKKDEAYLQAKAIADAKYDEEVEATKQVRVKSRERAHNRSQKEADNGGAKAGKAQDAGVSSPTEERPRSEGKKLKAKKKNMRATKPKPARFYFGQKNLYSMVLDFPPLEGPRGYRPPSEAQDGQFFVFLEAMTEPPHMGMLRRYVNSKSLMRIFKGIRRSWVWDAVGPHAIALLNYYDAASRNLYRACRALRDAHKTLREYEENFRAIWDKAKARIAEENKTRDAKSKKRLTLKRRIQTVAEALVDYNTVKHENRVLKRENKRIADEIKSLQDQLKPKEPSILSNMWTGAQRLLGRKPSTAERTTGESPEATKLKNEINRLGVVIRNIERERDNDRQVTERCQESEGKLLNHLGVVTDELDRVKAEVLELRAKLGTETEEAEQLRSLLLEYGHPLASELGFGPAETLAIMDMLVQINQAKEAVETQLRLSNEDCERLDRQICNLTEQLATLREQHRVLLLEQGAADVPGQGQPVIPNQQQKPEDDALSRDMVRSLNERIKTLTLQNMKASRTISQYERELAEMSTGRVIRRTGTEGPYEQPMTVQHMLNRLDAMERREKENLERLKMYEEQRKQRAPLVPINLSDSTLSKLDELLHWATQNPPTGEGRDAAMAELVNKARAILGNDGGLIEGTLDLLQGFVDAQNEQQKKLEADLAQLRRDEQGILIMREKIYEEQAELTRMRADFNERLMERLRVLEDRRDEINNAEVQQKREFAQRKLEIEEAMAKQLAEKKKREAQIEALRKQQAEEQAAAEQLLDEGRARFRVEVEETRKRLEAEKKAAEAELEEAQTKLAAQADLMGEELRVDAEIALHELENEADRVKREVTAARVQSAEEVARMKKNMEVEMAQREREMMEDRVRQLEARRDAVLEQLSVESGLRAKYEEKLEQAQKKSVEALEKAMAEIKKWREKKLEADAKRVHDDHETQMKNMGNHLDELTKLHAAQEANLAALKLQLEDQITRAKEKHSITVQKQRRRLARREGRLHAREQTLEKKLKGLREARLLVEAKMRTMQEGTKRLADLVQRERIVNDVEWRQRAVESLLVRYMERYGHNRVSEACFCTLLQHWLPGVYRATLRGGCCAQPIIRPVPVMVEVGVPRRGASRTSSSSPEDFEDAASQLDTESEVDTETETTTEEAWYDTETDQEEHDSSGSDSDPDPGSDSDADTERAFPQNRSPNPASAPAPAPAWAPSLFPAATSIPVNLPLTPPGPAPVVPLCTGHHGHGHLKANGEMWACTCQILTTAVWVVLLVLSQLTNLRHLFWANLAFVLGLPGYIFRLGHFSIRHAHRRIWRLLPANMQDSLLAPDARISLVAPRLWGKRPSPAALVGTFVVSTVLLTMLAAEATRLERNIWLGANDDKFGYLTALRAQRSHWDQENIGRTPSPAESVQVGPLPVPISPLMPRVGVPGSDMGAGLAAPDYRLVLAPLTGRLFSFAHDVLFPRKERWEWQNSLGGQVQEWGEWLFS